MFAIDSFIDNTRTPDGAGIEVVNSDELSGSHWDSGLRRPYLSTDPYVVVNGEQFANPYRGKVCVDVYKGHNPKKDDNDNWIANEEGETKFFPSFEPQLVTERLAAGLPVLQVDNATTLTKDQWNRIDATVMKSARQRLRAYADLRAANTFGGFDGMATPILEHEIMTDPGEAIQDMEGLAEGRNAAPSFAIQGLPLPITHSDFYLAQRFLATSRTKGQAQDMIRAEIAARRVAELIEKVTIGTVAGVQYGVSSTASSYLQTSKVYGYTTHPNRITKTDLQTSASMKSALLTAGASGGGSLFLTDVLEMIEDASNQNFFGPYTLYISAAYDNILDHDFKPESDKTIRSRVMELDKINNIRRLDYLSGDVMILVQMTPDVAQAVNGLEITTVQWDTKGGMQKNFKVMAIQVPRIRSVYVSGGTTEKTGIVHGTTS